MSETNNHDIINNEEAARAKKAKWAAIWDKVTTGILILLMASPALILAYIFIWLANAI